jgi:hypothetical protein
MGQIPNARDCLKLFFMEHLEEIKKEQIKIK